MSGRKHKILYFDPSPLWVPHICKQLEAAGFDYELVQDPAQLDELAGDPARIAQFSAALIDTNLGDTNLVAVCEKLNRASAALPIAVISEEDLQEHLEAVVAANATIFLIKPIQPSEFAEVLDKLSGRRNWNSFGDLLDPGAKKFKFDVWSSKQVRAGLAVVGKAARECGLNLKNFSAVELLLQEMLSNALYHSHGHTQAKEDSLPLELKSGEYVEVHYGWDAQRFALEVVDFKGSLSLEKIYETLEKNHKATVALRNQEANSDNEIDDLVETKGRGLDLVRKLAADHYYLIKPRECTRAIVLFDSRFHKDDVYSPLKIFIENRP